MTKARGSRQLVFFAVTRVITMPKAAPSAVPMAIEFMATPIATPMPMPIGIHGAQLQKCFLVLLFMEIGFTTEAQRSRSSD